MSKQDFMISVWTVIQRSSISSCHFKKKLFAIVKLWISPCFPMYSSLNFPINADQRTDFHWICKHAHMSNDNPRKLFENPLKWYLLLCLMSDCSMWKLHARFSLLYYCHTTKVRQISIDRSSQIARTFELHPPSRKITSDLRKSMSVLK